MCKASKRKSPNDAKRYIKSEYCTADGELAQIENFSLNQDMIDQESHFDGSAPEIIKINGGRWIIENGFRTMKTDLRARPVYLKRDDRIKAHFLTCFLSLLLYKYLEKKVNRYPKKILRLQIPITAICSLKICQIALNESVKDRNLIQCKLKCKTDKVWNEFETIQSDIFDHLIAMSSEFGLKMYQLSV